MKTRKILSLLLVLAILCGLMLFSASATGSIVNPLTVTGVMTLTFGDTTSPTWPESDMYFELDSGTTYNAVYSTDGTTENTGYYPSLLSMYIVPATGKTISSITGTDVTFVTYAADGTPSTSTSCTVNSAGFYAICPQSANSKIVITSSDSSTVTVKFKAPVTQTSSGGTTPLTVCGYLPVGQFARPNSFGWGTIFTDSTNVYTSSKTPKFLSGYTSTGVSLGMLGGFVQFEFENAIGNDDDNPYGIDFIVYGNPFNGNPEAGSVMVYGYNDDAKAYGWYNLAGSLHYASGTKWNVNISYIKITSDNTTIGSRTFGKKGVYYSTNFAPPASDNSTSVNSAISAAAWYAIPNVSTVTNPVSSANTTGTSPNNTVANGYWPEREANENYKYVWKMWTSSDGSTVDEHVDGVYWFTAGSAPVITYKGVTQVQDDDFILRNEQNVTQAMMTDVYRWGYADVRENGTNYGVAVNPYASAPSAGTGGDGFDLSWAVDTNGEPVVLTDVKFVRVYSAVLFNAGTFGETSTEVCGIYVASGSGSGAPTTQTNSLYITGPTTVGLNPSGGVQVQAGNYTITSNATYIFVNGVPFTSGNTVPVSAGNPVQIITQTGTESPRVVLLYV